MLVLSIRYVNIPYSPLPWRNNRRAWRNNRRAWWNNRRAWLNNRRAWPGRTPDSRGIRPVSDLLFIQYVNLPYSPLQWRNSRRARRGRTPDSRGIRPRSDLFFIQVDFEVFEQPLQFSFFKPVFQSTIVYCCCYAHFAGISVFCNKGSLIDDPFVRLHQFMKWHPDINPVSLKVLRIASGRNQRQHRKEQAPYTAH